MGCNLRAFTHPVASLSIVQWQTTDARIRTAGREDAYSVGVGACTTGRVRSVGKISYIVHTDDGDLLSEEITARLVSRVGDLATVSGRLGHGGGGATTLRVYAAWVAASDQRAAEILAATMPPRHPRSTPAGRETATMERRQDDG